MRESIVVAMAGLLVGQLAAAPALKDRRLAEGVRQMELPDGQFVLQSTADGDVKVTVKSEVVATARRVFLRDGPRFVEIRAEHRGLRFSTPATDGRYCDTTIFNRAEILVPPTAVHWTDKARAGDVVLTTPRVRVLEGADLAESEGRIRFVGRPEVVPLPAIPR